MTNSCKNDLNICENFFFENCVSKKKVSVFLKTNKEIPRKKYNLILNACRKNSGL